MAEHLHVRESAGLFDVSHMGQLVLRGEGVDRALEAVLPGDLTGLGESRIRYSLLLNEGGGILDDLMVTRLPAANPFDADDALYVVVNGATKYDDIGYLLDVLGDDITMNLADDQALLALQGPKAVDALARMVPGVADLVFMTAGAFDWQGVPLWISRSGYTGEDGFEISVAAEHAEDLWRLLTRSASVKPVGLGARDSLRLEAGLPLYGHDINPETSPVEAGLAWSSQRRRREEGGFPGHIRISEELANGPLRRRVGIRVEGRAPAREHADILDLGGELIGKVTSGGFGPSVGGPVAMGYVVPDFAKPGTRLALAIRDKRVSGEVVKLPFVPHRYRR
jgi:aminomethyltransferase